MRSADALGWGLAGEGKVGTPMVMLRLRLPELRGERSDGSERRPPVELLRVGPAAPLTFRFW